MPRPRVYPAPGETFGDLTVKFAVVQAGRSTLVCACSCGREKTVRASHLISGHTTSCGHARGPKRRTPAPTKAPAAAAHVMAFNDLFIGGIG